MTKTQFIPSANYMLVRRLLKATGCFIVLSVMDRENGVDGFTVTYRRR